MVSSGKGAGKGRTDDLGGEQNGGGRVYDEKLPPQKNTTAINFLYLSACVNPRHKSFVFTLPPQYPPVRVAGERNAATGKR